MRHIGLSCLDPSPSISTPFRSPARDCDSRSPTTPASRFPTLSKYTRSDCGSKCYAVKTLLLPDPETVCCTLFCFPTRNRSVSFFVPLYGIFLRVTFATPSLQKLHDHQSAHHAIREILGRREGERGGKGIFIIHGVGLESRMAEHAL